MRNPWVNAVCLFVVQEVFLKAHKAKQEIQLTPEIAKYVSEVWADPGIKRVFDVYRARVQVSDSADYFFDNVHRIADPKYVPSYPDGATITVLVFAFQHCTFSASLPHSNNGYHGDYVSNQKGCVC